MKVSQASYVVVVLIVVLAAAWRLWIIQGDNVAFSSDEAVVALMARHISQGDDIPTFYYGQDYMGSLDAIFIAGGFLLIDDSVHTVRLVQTILFLGTVVSTYALALKVTQSRRVALMSMLLVAFPNILAVTYTSATLGGYNEIILLGNLMLWLGWHVTVNKSATPWVWLLLGGLAGVGWWVNAAIIVPIAVIGLMGLSYFSLSKWHLYLTSLAGFMIGGLPWWLYNLRNDWAALQFLLEDDAVTTENSLTTFEKIIGYLLLGLPTLYGLRMPWEAAYLATVSTAIAGLVYLFLIIRMFALMLKDGRSMIQQPSWSAGAWVWLNLGVMTMVFLGSGFLDSTGRYLLPIWVPLMIGLALGINRLRIDFSPIVSAVALCAILGLHVFSVFTAINQPTGIETQLSADLRTPAENDVALMEFLAANDYTHGYGSYWLSYRFMYQFDEQIIFDTSLPYDDKGYRPHNNRYPLYVDEVAVADRVFWVTHNFPDLDALIVAIFERDEVSYEVTQIGDYVVYHNLSVHVSPADYGLNSTESFDEVSTHLLETP